MCFVLLETMLSETGFNYGRPELSESSFLSTQCQRSREIVTLRSPKSKSPYEPAWAASVDEDLPLEHLPSHAESSIAALNLIQEQVVFLLLSFDLTEIICSCCSCRWRQTSWASQPFFLSQLSSRLRSHANSNLPTNQSLTSPES